MDHFSYRDNALYAEEVAIADIIQHVGSPCYVYSRATLERHWRVFDQAFQKHPHLICYAVKANSNLAVLDVLARLGSGFDIVSGGELERVLTAGGVPKKVVFSGVGKLAWEIERALQVGIYCFNVESTAELERIQSIARHLDVIAPVALRINPDIDPKTHPYISTGLKENKFGIGIAEAQNLYYQAHKSPHLEMMGIDCHIGSQLTELQPFLNTLDRLLVFVNELQTKNIPIQHLNLGGGLGVRYRDEKPPHPTEQITLLLQQLQRHPMKIILEPGRAIAANAGILVAQVAYLKVNDGKHFAIVDAGMNDLLRPALYQAWQEIVPVQQRVDGALRLYDVVGPVCETGDFLGKQRQLNIQAGDLLAVRGAGAYSFVMSSNYNSRPRAAEVMVDGSQFQVVRQREHISDLFAHESLLA